MMEVGLPTGGRWARRPPNIADIIKLYELDFIFVLSSCRFFSTSEGFYNLMYLECQTIIDLFGVALEIKNIVQPDFTHYAIVFLADSCLKKS
jgi:hypothetical protein